MLASLQLGVKGDRDSIAHNPPETMKAILLNPVPKFLGEEAKKIAALKSAGHSIVGVEVTVPALAALCDVNIDPQHECGDSQMSAIWAIASGEFSMLGFSNPVYATIRPDLDAFGGMVVANLLREQGQSSLKEGVIARILKVHEADTYANAGEWQPRELFSGGYETPALAAIARAISDRSISIETRLEWMENWLVSGDEPTGYRQAYEREKQSIASALESGSTKLEVKLFDDGLGGYKAISVVQSDLRAATSIGYAKAPVVVALNPRFPMDGGTGKKYTVCQYSTGHVDMPRIWEQLSALEPGWGGSPVIGGSPQGQSSKLALETVVGIVADNLL